MNIAPIGFDSRHVRISLPDSDIQDGWSQTTIDISVAGFHRHIAPWSEAWELDLFVSLVRVPDKRLEGKAELHLMEE